MIRKKKIIDIFRKQLEIIDSEIYNALKKDDIERLKGIQSLASSLWTWTHGGTALLSFIIRGTVEKRKEKEEIIFSLDEINKIMKRMSTTKELLFGFADSGYIKIIDKNPEGYEGYPKEVWVSLTPIWDNMLRRLYKNKKEKEVFTHNIGSLLTLSILSKQEGRPCGLRLWKALASMCDEADNNNREVSLDTCKVIFSKEGRTGAKYYQLLAFDNQRVKDIRFIEKNDGEKITITENALNAYRIIRQRADGLVRKEYRK